MLSAALPARSNSELSCGTPQNPDNGPKDSLVARGREIEVGQCTPQVAASSPAEIRLDAPTFDTSTRNSETEFLQPPTPVTNEQPADNREQNQTINPSAIDREKMEEVFREAWKHFPLPFK